MKIDKTQRIMKYLQGTPSSSFSIDKGKITQWESKTPKPTDKQLKDIEKEIEAENTIKEIKIKKAKDIIKISSVSDQLNLMAKVIDTLTAIIEKSETVSNEDKEIFAEARDIKTKIDNIRNK